MSFTPVIPLLPYDSVRPYVPGDEVAYNGVIYRALISSQGNAPGVNPVPTARGIVQTSNNPASGGTANPAGTSFSASFGTPSTAGNALIAIISGAAPSTTTTVTIPGFTLIDIYNAIAGPWTAVFYRNSAPATTTVTATMSAQVNYLTMVLFEINGSVTVDGVNHNRVNATAQTNSITTSAVDLVIAAYTEDTGALGATPSGWTASFTYPGTNGEPFIVFTQNNVAPGAVSITYTHSTSSTYSGVMCGLTLGPTGQSWQAVTPTTPTRVVTATDSMIAFDGTVLCSGTFVETLPPVATAVIGRRYTVKNTGTGTITVTPASGTVDGAANKPITVQYSSFDFVTDGTNWFTV